MKNNVISKITLIFTLCAASAVTCIYAADNNQEPPRQLIEQYQVDRFGYAIAHIKELYVEPKSDEDIFDNALRGMLSGLDPHSSYLDEESLKAMTTFTEGEFSGVGIQISSDRGFIKVISAIDGTPAEEANIRTDDYIVGVDGESLIDVPIDKAVSLMRGKAGTKVTLTIAHEGEKPRDVTIVREPIPIESVKGRMLPKDYGYVRVSYFNDKTADQLKAEVNKLLDQGNGHLNGLVLDLRNNPGGLLGTSVKTADLFLDSNKLGDNKKIVYTKSRIPAADIEENAKPGDMLAGVPIVILINRGSASGSEIVAGALQAHKRAVLLGERTFGKGSVQTLFPLDDKSAIKLTTSLYYTPNGQSIQAKGITPDILVSNLTLKADDNEEEDAIFLQKIRESSLNKHLSANDDASKIDEEQKQEENLSKEMKKLAYEDHQLYTAINILQSMNLLQTQRTDV
ncbi:MAG: S41 family peptidase [Pseudomonadota bacterium]